MQPPKQSFQSFLCLDRKRFQSYPSSSHVNFFPCPFSRTLAPPMFWLPAPIGGCALSSSVCTFKKKQVETGLTWIPSMVIACSPAAVATGAPKSSGSLCYLLPQPNRLKFLAEAGLFIKHDRRAAHALHGWAGGAGRRNAG